MNVRETSVMAYEAIKPTLGEKQAAVLAVIKAKGAICNYDIAQELGISICRVTPRTTELVKGGLVTEAFKAKCKSTNRTVIYWEPTPKETAKKITRQVKGGRL
jgi:predicted transcriptional regulator